MSFLSITNSTDSSHPTDDRLREHDAVLPRAKRRRKKAKGDRGLPPDKEIAALAEAYLLIQAKHWPKLVNAGLIPSVTAGAIDEMVEDFKSRHRTGHCSPEAVKPFQKYVGKLAGSYNRYSCDNSSPTSAIDQMTNSLNKAKEDGLFIPWSYVNCDYGVSGLDAGRQGYSAYKSILTAPEHFLDTTYIDDFTRASRDELEWWNLAALSKKHGKRMIGASDGFNLSDPNWDISMTIFGLLSRLFIKSLREKVTRGMRGRRRRGAGSLGKLPLGFTRQQERDQNGNVVHRSDGRPRYEICIDPETAEYRRLIFELFTQRNWTVFQITKHFNQHKVDGWDGWTESTIRDLLWSPTAIGVFIWNMYRNEFDWDTKAWIKTKNRGSAWEIHVDRKLAVVPLEWWRAARRRIARARRPKNDTGKCPSRNEIAATTLFSGTLYCEDCGGELMLTRSTPKYKQMGCQNGPTGIHGCGLSTSKSTRIIEKCLLKYLRESLLTDDAVSALVSRANAFLEEEAKKPRQNIAPLKANAASLQRKIDKLLNQIEDESDKDRIKVYDARVVQRQRELDAVRKEIREAERHNTAPPPPLDASFVRKSLADIEGLLDADVAVAAEAIRALTGPIKIRQEKIPGRKRGARWIATFAPDLLRLLRKVGHEKNYPDCITLEFLIGGNWIIPNEVTVTIESLPAYEVLKSELREKHSKGASKRALAVAYGLSEAYVGEIIKYSETGKKPQFVRGRRTGNQAGKTPKYLEIQDDVVRLRDVEEMPFPEIAEWLLRERDIEVSESTVNRAWDVAHRQELAKAADEFRDVRRGRYSQIGGTKRALIFELLRKESTVEDVVREVGSSRSTVYRIRNELRCGG